MGAHGGKSLKSLKLNFQTKTQGNVKIHLPQKEKQRAA